MKKIYRIFLEMILLLSFFKLNAQANADHKSLAADIRIVSFDDTELIWPDYSYEPKATVKNFGKGACAFNVIMTIGSNYKSNKYIILNPGAAVTIIFDPVEIAPGAYDFQAKVISAADSNSLNNTLSENVIVVERNSIK